MDRASLRLRHVYGTSIACTSQSASRFKIDAPRMLAALRLCLLAKGVPTCLVKVLQNALVDSLPAPFVQLGLRHLESKAGKP
eukprot:5494664-Alexandrium_andersonii.AAC.1